MKITKLLEEIQDIPNPQNVFVREAKKDKKEEPADEEPADEEPEDEEPADEDVEFGDVENPEQTIQTNLQSALEAAKSLGDDTLTQQIGNTITFFTRKFVVGLEDEDGKDAQIPSPSPEEPSELDEIYRNKMLRIAGILK